MDSDRSFEVPPDLYYEGERHLWVRASGGALRVGIDAIGLESLGELAYVALHPVGSSVVRGEPVGTLEAAKTTSSILAPASGTLVRRNEAALRDPLFVNEDPYGEGWLFEIDPTSPASWESEAAELISGAAIAAWAAAEIERLREEAPSA